MKSTALLLFISVGVSVSEVCENDEVACSNSMKCIPYRFICNGHDDCSDSSDEDSALCNAWARMNRICYTTFLDCMNREDNKCVDTVEISEFCNPENPMCTGELDMRICLMLEGGRIDKLSKFPLPTEETVSDLQISIKLGTNFKSALPYTMSHVRCPGLYTLVGEQCLSFFYVGGISWGESRAFCNVLGGDLLTFKNAKQFGEIIQHLKSHELTSDFWIGGSIESTTAGWTWLNGSPMEMGSPFWATRYSPTCIQRNVTTAKSETTCYRYYQAPEEVTKGQCVSLSYEHSFYMTDEDCLRKMSPLCIYQGDDFPIRTQNLQSALLNAQETGWYLVPETGH